ncbi:MAG: YeeE/YedE thiosulfate transporter family protein [Gemmatimonadota bacterium]|jgi:uncharacterized membrane protein YedE/YeeE
MKPGNDPKTFMNPYLAGVILGVVLFAAYFLTGSGLGASGGIARLMVALQDLVASSHVDRVGHLAGMAGGNTNPLDHWIIPMMLGTLLGGFGSAFLNGRFKAEVQKGPRISVRTRLTMAVLGGAFMGFGARLARGCTSGQALSGGAVLSVGSWAFMLAVFAGGYALAYSVRRLWT